MHATRCKNGSLYFARTSDRKQVWSIDTKIFFMKKVSNDQLKFIS